MKARSRFELGFRYFSMSVLGTFTALVFWTVWSLAWPYDAITMKPGSWSVQNPGKRVARGETLQLYVDYCANFAEPPFMDTRIEQDGRIMLLKSHQFPADPTGCHATVVPLVIPRVLAIESTTAQGTGIAQLHVTLRYRLNALRTVEYQFTSEPFLIDP